MRPSLVYAVRVGQRFFPRSLQHTPVHALVIGINEYKSSRIDDLYGAVPDADAMVEYLRTDLHVSDSQITNLRNGEATRAAILRELRALHTRDSIRRDDPIVVFYAGHGATAPAPKSWATGGQKVSLIVPHDCFSLDEDEELIHAISDRTLVALLDGLAAKEDGTGKGDNIASTESSSLDTG